jgi:hypothetical protein
LKFNASGKHIGGGKPIEVDRLSYKRTRSGVLWHKICAMKLATRDQKDFDFRETPFVLMALFSALLTVQPSSSSHSSPVFQPFSRHFESCSHLTEIRRESFDQVDDPSSALT